MGAAMQTNRRLLFKGLAAAGLGAYGLGSLGLVQAAAPVSVPASQTGAAAGYASLVSLSSGLHSSALDAAFNAGVRQASQGNAHTSQLPSHAQLLDLSSASVQQLQTQLADGQDSLLVGLLDDASAALVLALVRSAGGRVLHEQHYRAPEQASAWAEQLGAALVQGHDCPTCPAEGQGPALVALRCLI